MRKTKSFLCRVNSEIGEKGAIVKTLTCCATALLIVFLFALNGRSWPQARNDSPVLDENISVVGYHDLDYAVRAKAARIQGVVVVHVNLDERGNVTTARGISGAEQLLPDCLTNAKKWRLRPNAMKAAVIVYNFRLSDGVSTGRCDSFTFESPNLATITTCPLKIR